MKSVRWSWALATFVCGLALSATGAWALAIELQARAEIAALWGQVRQQAEAQP